MTPSQDTMTKPIHNVVSMSGGKDSTALAIEARVQ